MGDVAYLECPECGEDAVPSCAPGPSWCEDDEAVCPGCGALVGVSVDEDPETCALYAYAVVRDDALHGGG